MDVPGQRETKPENEAATAVWNRDSTLLSAATHTLCLSEAFSRKLNKKPKIW